MGATDEGGGATRVPQVQESLLERPSPKQAAQDRIAHSEAQSKLDHYPMGKHADREPYP